MDSVLVEDQVVGVAHLDAQVAAHEEEEGPHKMELGAWMEDGQIKVGVEIPQVVEVRDVQWEVGANQESVQGEVVR